MNILIVDDDESVAEVIRRRLEEQIEGSNVETETSFDTALERIRQFQPDLLVLDLLEGDLTENIASGLIKVRSKLERFVPLVFFSALGEPHDDLHTSPFETFISKNDENAENNLIAQIKWFIPHIAALQQVEADIHTVAMKVLEKAAGPIWDLEDDTTRRTDLLKRSVRRRIAASIDSVGMKDGEVLLPWEQYIYPALGTDLLMGDVLGRRNAEGNDPEAYRLVLTPSCDLVMRNGRAKVSSVLVACCVSIDAFLSACQVSRNRLADRSDRKDLKRALTRPQSDGFIALPGYASVLPYMASQLHKLELLSITDGGIEGADGVVYDRVASVDSPFREALSWAYLQIAGRPSIPDRDNEVWIEGIRSAIDKARVIQRP